VARLSPANGQAVQVSGLADDAASGGSSGSNPRAATGGVRAQKMIGDRSEVMELYPPAGEIQIRGVHSVHAGAQDKGRGADLDF